MVLPMYCSSIAYVDRVESDCNPKFGNLSINFTHNARGDSVTNVTFVFHVTITRILLYASLRAPENANDREYKRKLVNTVVDLEKVLKGFQSNIWVKGYVDNVLKSMDFEFKLPLRPVSKNCF